MNLAVTLVLLWLTLSIFFIPSLVAAENIVGYSVNDRYVYDDSFRVRGYGTELAVDSVIEINVKKIEDGEITFERVESGTVSWPRSRTGILHYIDSHNATISSFQGDSFRVKNLIVYADCDREFLMGEAIHAVRASITVQSGQFMFVLDGTLPQYTPLDDDGLLDIIIDPALLSGTEFEIGDTILDVAGPESVQVPAGSFMAYTLSTEDQTRWYDAATGLLVRKEVRSDVGSDTLELVEVELTSQRQDLCASVVPEFAYYASAVIAVAVIMLIVTTKTHHFKKEFADGG